MWTVCVNETACIWKTRIHTGRDLQGARTQAERAQSSARTGTAHKAYGINVTVTISEHVWHWLECLLSKNLALVCTMRKNRVEFQCIFTDKKGNQEYIIWISKRFDDSFCPKTNY